MNLKNMKAGLKDLDWKKLLLEKGEKIGLIVAGVFAALMVLPFLWYMVLGNGPNANAELLKKPTEELEKKQASSQPTDADKPPPGDTKVVVKNLKIDDTAPYRLAQLTSGGAGNDSGKRMELTGTVPTRPSRRRTCPGASAGIQQ